MTTPPIEHYDFGQIIIHGQTHRQDVIIFPDQVFTPWWRAQGHLLQSLDLKTVFAAAPTTLVVGQGAYGRMAIAPETETALEAAGIQLITLPTQAACETYNKLYTQGQVVAALHLTC